MNANTCEPARCGDGIVQIDVEECDDGNTSDEDDCTSACQAAGVAMALSKLEKAVMTEMISMTMTAQTLAQAPIAATVFFKMVRNVMTETLKRQTPA